MYHLQVPLSKLEVEKFFREGLRFFFWGGGLRNFKRGRESSGGGDGVVKYSGGIIKLKLWDPNLN